MQIYDLLLTFLSIYITFKTFNKQPVVFENIIYKTILDFSIKIHSKYMP